jgi:hypothetical protein
MLRLLTISTSALLLAGCVTSEYEDLVGMTLPTVPSSAVEWEVVNRFRLLDGEAEEQRFHRSLSSYIEEYEDWYTATERGAFINALGTDLIHPEAGTDEEGARPNFRTHYNPQSMSYRCSEPGQALCGEKDGETNWIADRDRTVRLKATALGHGACTWKLDEQAFSAPCSGAMAHVQADRPVRVEVQSSRGGAVLSDTLFVRDVRIVALGDSFSSGEGVPHAQWRGLLFDRSPALWLDARCHRSLLSAPSLAAAYLARQNPHLSVTLLHYGCSGASIANGVMTPSAYLETYENVARRYENSSKVDLEEAPADERPARFQPHDVGPSQLEQAANDLLSQQGAQSADAVVISIGGNDVGFSDLVRSILAPRQTPTDLLPVPEPDNRPVVSFDQARWMAASSNVDCAAEGIDCLASHVIERLNGANGSLREQYVRLHGDPRLVDLTAADPRRVFLTAYPNFLRRARNDFDGQRSDADTVHCVDRPLDGRPEMASSLLTAFVGMRGGAARDAEAKLLDPLNATLANAARDQGWTFVSGHVVNGAANGYCSHRRYYNTLPDAYYQQGRLFGRKVPRPLGNLVIREAVPGTDLKPGDEVIWSASARCFVRYGVNPAPCLPIDSSLAFQFRRDMGPVDWNNLGAAYEQGDWKGDLFSTGPVHPNLFGHCNAAAAIVSSIVTTNPTSIPFREGLEKTIWSRPVGLVADDICAASSWGYVRAH